MQLKFKNNVTRNYVRRLISTVRMCGGDEFWVLNQQNMEIYKFKITQISDFDIQIDLFNALLNENIFTGYFVMHMHDKIIDLLNEVPGIIYDQKLECYRTLYYGLNNKVLKASKKIKDELIEKIEFIETEFPQLII